MEAQKLAKGFQGTVSVTEVEENYDKPFQKTKGESAGEWVYCHRVNFRLSDGTEDEFVSQVCASQKHLAFGVGDSISITVKAFTMQVYTIAVEAFYPRSAMSAPAPPKGSVNLPHIEHVGPRHPMIVLTGTPGEIALRESMNYHANRYDSTLEDVIATADIFKKYILENTQ